MDICIKEIRLYTISSVPCT